MLRWLVLIPLLASGYGVALLLYGKEGLAMREKQGKNNTLLIMGLSSLMFFWGLSLLLFIGDNTSIDTIIGAFGIPIILIAIGIRTRANVKKALSNNTQSKE